jgi:hypothetical protein
MNTKQKALLDEVNAAGGQLWVEVTRTYSDRSPKSEGQARMNTLDSMVSEKDRRYCPGGYRREVVLHIVEEEKIKRYKNDDPSAWLVEVDRILVKVL